MNVFQKGPLKQSATMQAQVIQDVIAQARRRDAWSRRPRCREPVSNDLDAGIVVVTHEGASQSTMYDIKRLTRHGIRRAFIYAGSFAEGHG